MKRELLLLRHAKSSWSDPGLEDYDRPLAARGRAAALLVGRDMNERGWYPQMALISSSVRTRETWRLVATGLSHAPMPTFRDALYEASADQLLAQIHGTPASVGTLLVLAHNPGQEELALLIAGKGSDDVALRQMRRKFPTAALARFEFSGRWNALGVGAARLTHFIRPKDLS